jgi:protein phosphatase
MGANLEWGMVCDRGTVRTENQDAAFLRLPAQVVRLPANGSWRELRGGRTVIPSADDFDDAADRAAPDLLALVADGMGGPPGGAQASQIIQGIVADELSGAQFADASAYLSELIERCDQAVYAEAEAHDLHGMGSTCTILMFAGARIHLCHVGDSRCYRIRPAQESMEQWSRDHNVAAHLVDEGVLTPEEARTHRASHALTQAVGLGKELTPQLGDIAMPSVEEVFLLCTDGLLRVVEEREVLQAFVRACHESASGAPAGKTYVQATVEQLLELANRRGSPDNVSLLALCLRPAD